METEVGDEAKCEALAGTDKTYGRVAWLQAATDVNSGQQGCTRSCSAGQVQPKGGIDFLNRLRSAVSLHRHWTPRGFRLGLPGRNWQADSQEGLIATPFLSPWEEFFQRGLVLVRCSRPGSRWTWTCLCFRVEDCPPFASMFLHTLGGSDRFTMPAPGLAHP